MRTKPSAVRDDITKRLVLCIGCGQITQTELAKLSGLPQSAISMGLSGYRPFNRIDVLDTLYALLPRIEKRQR